MSETVEIVERSPLYQERYGQWAGRPEGAAPDYARCCIETFPQGRGEMHRQCRKPRGHGPDGAYCKTHDPEAVAKREAESEAESRRKYVAERNKRRYEWHGRSFYEVIKQIAEGHNDARGLAQETLVKFHAGEYK